MTFKTKEDDGAAMLATPSVVKRLFCVHISYRVEVMGLTLLFCSNSIEVLFGNI
jgi:hypothetical protein